MDPLDQRLTDAGLAWRQTQPEPPALDPMLVALRQRRSIVFQGRLMFAFIASLLLVAAVAIAPGVGSFLHQLQPSQPPVLVPSGPPVSSPLPSSPESSPTSPEPASAKPAPPTPPPSDALAAAELVHKYEDGLVSGHWQGAFDLLSPTSLTAQAGPAAFATERAQFFASAGDRYVVGGAAPIGDWSRYGPDVVGADREHAYLVQVDYPALAGNNAGFEQFVVAWDASGTWRIWPVR